MQLVAYHLMLTICETCARHRDHNKCDVELAVGCKRTCTAYFGMLCLDESLLCMLLSVKHCTGCSDCLCILGDSVQTKSPPMKSVPKALMHAGSTLCMHETAVTGISVYLLIQQVWQW